MVDLAQLVNAVVEGNRTTARLLVEQALAAGEDASRIVREALIPAMDEAGRRFANNDYFMPELLVATRALREVLDVLRPLLVEAQVYPAGVALVASVSGDAHGITGVLLVALLEGAGFSVIDLGGDISVPALEAALEAHRPCLLCVTVASAATLPQLRDLLEAVNGRKDRHSFHVVTIGAPVTPRFAEEHGADAQAEHAPAAVQQARMWLAR
jgi:methanogenic corrinoid protein MtbC1